MPHRSLLPDGRTVAIDQGSHSLLCCGVIVLDPVRVFDNPEVAESTRVLAAALKTKYAGKLPSEIAPLAEARTLYKSFCMDPSRHRPSSEALLRRVVKGQDLYQINNAVDCCNLASLSFLLPIGMYDLKKVQGDVTLRAGLSGESYPGIRKGEVNLTKRLGLFDELGPFGSPTSDSARTCVDDQTQGILAVVMATAQYSNIAMAENLEIFADLFAAHCESADIHRCVLGGV